MSILATLDLAGFDREGLWLIAEISLKGTLLLLAAAAIAFACRRASAAQRHLVWATAFGVLLILPVVSFVGPRWEIPSEQLALVEATQPAPVGDPVPSTIVIRSDAPAVDVARSSTPSTLSWRPVALAIWAGGALLILGLLLSAMIRVALITHRASPLRRGPVVERAAALVRVMGMGRSPRLLESSREIGIPLAYGILSPVILLPRGATEWAPGRLDAVLLHELAHIRRRDLGIQLVSQIACALYWFNPLVWLALQRLRLESEHACDDSVLHAGVRATTYADDLVEFARSIRAQRVLALAITPMAAPSQLPRRIRALLEDRRRGAVSPRAVITSLVLGITLCAAVAGATPSSDTIRSEARVSEQYNVSRARQPVSAPGLSWSPVPEGGQPSAVVSESPTATAPSDTTRPVLLNLEEVDRLVVQHYPQRLKQAGVSGTALVQLEVDSLGRVAETRILAVSDPAFAEPARRSLSAARFAPARSGGEPVASRIQWPIAFNALSALARPSGTDAELNQLLRLQLVRSMEEAARDAEAVPLAHAETRAELRQRLSEIADSQAALDSSTAQVRAATSRVWIATEAVRNTAYLTRRILDGTVREAISRHQPAVLERGIGNDQYVWLLVAPDGEVRRSGIAQKERPDQFSSAEVLAELAERGLDTGYEFMQLSHLRNAGPAGEDIAFAWIVVQDRQPQ